MKVPFMKKIGIILSLGLLIGFVGCKTNTTEEITLTEIKLDTTAVKTEFTVDEIFTTDGLVVTAVYSDGTTKEVTGWTTSGFDSSVPVESQEITVSYTENEITKTATYKITIKAKAEGGNTGGEGGNTGSEGGNTGGEGGNTGGEGGNTGGEGGSENPPATNVAYKVEHYQQNIADNNYTLVTVDTENKTGTTLSDTAAVAKIYTGFTAKTFAQEKIAADGSTVVKIYYDRNSYTIKFDTDGGTEINDITLKFGATVTAPENPTKTGFVFEKWDAAIPATMPAANITFKASWKKIDSAFDVTLDKNNEIQLTYTSTKANEICFTAPEGYASYQWYCDGKEITELEDKNQNVCRIATDKLENEIPFSRAELMPYFTDGKHEILVIVKDSNGVYNSAKATFYVYN